MGQLCSLLQPSFVGIEFGALRHRNVASEAQSTCGCGRTASGIHQFFPIRFLVGAALLAGLPWIIAKGPEPLGESTDGADLHS